MKNSYFIKTQKADSVLLKEAQRARGDLVGFIQSQGGVRCASAVELDIASDTHLFVGNILRAERQLSALRRTASRAGISIPFVYAKA
jgi:hypothetical protein